jgi:outer membrane protein assembly factor BamA
MRRLLAVAALLGAAPIPLAAQRYWKETLYPLPFYSAADGLWLWGHYGRWSPIGFVERPEPYLAALNFDAGASTQGSASAAVDLQAPAWWDGWRVGLTASVARANRLGYYGIGNATTYSSDSTGSGRQYFYRVSRTTQAVRLTVQRRLAGGLRALAGATVTHTNYRALPGTSRFGQDLAAGLIDRARTTDASARAGLVFDSRDHEIDPHQGVFADALYTAGDGYHRVTAGARVYVRPLEKLTIAMRLEGEDVRGDAPLPELTTIESSERQIPATGGYYSLRAYYDARFSGAGKLLGGVELRYALLWAPSLLEVKLVGFYEAGRVFAPGESWRLTTDGLHPSGGLELAARLQRNTLIATGVAFGDEGARFVLGVGWTF